ncbi:hypothetical protein PR002_g25703 [Phytophthora rubi]|uniref:Uncharacterized protein n=1 Tax=Phytophthora rubi TaxID=129364 RepID=A0A6A3HYK5_9STRA|nr:hypothetical protein PR002_g25703 [Phytophthora rubi]
MELACWLALATDPVTSTLEPRPSSRGPLHRRRSPPPARRALRPGSWLVSDGSLNYTITQCRSF